MCIENGTSGLSQWRAGYFRYAANNCFDWPRVRCIPVGMADTRTFCQALLQPNAAYRNSVSWQAFSYLTGPKTKF